jgi:hypothetical protein
VARPKTGETPIRHIRIPDAEWEDLRAVAGPDNVRVLRHLIRWYLRRDKMPARPSSEEIRSALGEAGDQ